MTAEIISAEPNSASKLSIEEIKHPDHSTESSEGSIGFAGGIYGLGIAALASVAALSREPNRTVNILLRKYQGLKGIADYTYAELLNQPDSSHSMSVEPDDTSVTDSGLSVIDVLTNFYRPNTLRMAYEIIGRSKNGYGNAIRVGVITDAIPAVIAGVQDRSRRFEPMPVLPEEPAVRLIDMMGNSSPENTGTHSIPLARDLITNAFRNRTTPDIVDSASLLFGVAMGYAQNAKSINVLHKDVVGKPEVSTVSY